MLQAEADSLQRPVGQVGGIEGLHDEDTDDGGISLGSFSDGGSDSWETVDTEEAVEIEVTWALIGHRCCIAWATAHGTTWPYAHICTLCPSILMWP